MPQSQSDTHILIESLWNRWLASKFERGVRSTIQLPVTAVIGTHVHHVADLLKHFNKYIIKIKITGETTIVDGETGRFMFMIWSACMTKYNGIDASGCLKSMFYIDHTLENGEGRKTPLAYNHLYRLQHESNNKNKIIVKHFCAMT